MESEISYKLVFYLGTLGMLVLTSAIIIFVYLYQRKLLKKKIAFQKIEDLLKKQELESAYALMEGQDIERRRIAAELHDNIGSILVTLNMYADTGLSATDQHKKDEMLNRMIYIINKASEETRKLSHRLDSGTLKHFGLKSAIYDLVEVVNKVKSIEIKSSIQLNDEIDNTISFNLYRVIQEMINNTLKHAKASIINLDVSSVGKEYISVIYFDNGIGIGKQQITEGIGLKNIHNRINKLSGELTIESNGKGFNAVIEIPLT
ncbi:MAG: histidine kinase [Bacteroidota bacterium]